MEGQVGRINYSLDDIPASRMLLLSGANQMDTNYHGTRPQVNR